MKKMFFVMCSLALLLAFGSAISAQEMQKKPADKPAKTKKEKPPMPTTDADIQKCIQDKLAEAPSLKANPPKVSVSGGVATITGEAKNGGQKGAASRIAKSCGAKEIKNDMTVAPKKN
jgi:osmotically-inducible protein OsmY